MLRAPEAQAEGKRENETSHKGMLEQSGGLKARSSEGTWEEMRREREAAASSWEPEPGRGEGRGARETWEKRHDPLEMDLTKINLQEAYRSRLK